MKTLLIFGASGFIGKSLIEYIKINGLKKFSINKIILVSRKNIRIGKSIKKVKVNCLRGDIKKIKYLPHTDYIFYLINDKNQDKSFKLFENFKNLIEKNKSKTKIIFTSSGAVYGVIKNKDETVENKKISINKIKKFNNYKKAYAMNKYKMEKILKKISNKNLNIVIARCFTFIGSQILKEKNYAISNFINSLKIRKKIFVNNPNTVRSYMSSQDLSEWLLKIITKVKNSYDIVNIGSDQEINMENLSKIIHKKHKSNFQLILRKNNKKDYYVPNIKKAKSKFGLKNRLYLNKSLDDILNI